MYINATYIPETIEARVKEVELPDGTVCLPNNIEHRTIPLVKPTEDSEWTLIPTVKSRRYNYLHHREAAQHFVNYLESALQNNGETPNVRYSVRFTDQYSKMIIHAIPDLTYTLDVEPFESSEVRTTYFKPEGNVDGDSFKPRITLINDFNGACTVEFGLFRNICSNGMVFGRVLRNILRFVHFDRRIQEKFVIETQNFMNHIFEQHFIQQIFNNLSQKETTKEELFQEIESNIGVRAKKAAEQQFDVPEVVNLWVAYNIITWILTHKIKNVMKAHILSKRYFERMYYSND